MSLSTSYRYEAMGEKKQLQDALRKQQERITLDETMAFRENQAKLESKTKLKSDWVEKLEHVAAVKKAKSDAKQNEAELHFAHKASIMVRRAALKQQMETEYQQFSSELERMGKAFYTKRT